MITEKQTDRNKRRQTKTEIETKHTDRQRYIDREIKRERGKQTDRNQERHPENNTQIDVWGRGVQVVGINESLAFIDDVFTCEEAHVSSCSKMADFRPSSEQTAEALTFGGAQ